MPRPDGPEPHVPRSDGVRSLSRLRFAVLEHAVRPATTLTLRAGAVWCDGVVWRCERGGVSVAVTGPSFQGYLAAALAPPAGR